MIKNAEARKKFQHLIRKLVINPQRGLGATATYEKVFSDYKEVSTKKTAKESSVGKTAKKSGKDEDNRDEKSTADERPSRSKSSTNALFNYLSTVNNAVIKQLMTEANSLDSKKYPGSATFLLRNIIEAILKHIIDHDKANNEAKNLDLEGSIGLCMSQKIKLSSAKKTILKEFNKMHVSHLNLGAHANVVPNHTRLVMARDCIDQFVKGHV